MYCAACGEDALRPHPNNAKGNDFHCLMCGAHYELKSGKGALGATVPDGAFATMMERIAQPGGGPHLVLLRYCPTALAVRDMLLVPGPFLTPDVILRRPPLAPTARRAGWIGCNIRIAEIPAAGRVAIIHDGEPLARSAVVAAVRRAVSAPASLAERGWFVDTLRCVERLAPEFALPELYAFEAELGARHPANQHIRPKIRQQLQRLRDAGLLIFLGEGRYRRVVS